MDDPRLRNCPTLLLLRPETNDHFKFLLKGRGWQRVHRASNLGELRHQLGKCRSEGPHDWLVFIDESIISLADVEVVLGDEPLVVRDWVVVCFTTAPFEGEVRPHPDRPHDLEVHWFRFEDTVATDAFADRLATAMHQLIVARLERRLASAAG